jgi:hypothetical protein
VFLDLVRHSFNRPKPLNDKSLQSIFAETKLVFRSAAKGKATWVVPGVYNVSLIEVIIRKYCATYWCVQWKKDILTIDYIF